MISGELQAVLDRLRRDAARYFPDRPAPPAVGRVQFVRRPLSDIAQVDLSFGDTTTAVYVKLHHKPNAPVDRVRHKAGLEFETLGFLHERFRSIPGCAVVRPIAYFPDEMAVVTEAAAGDNLHRLMKTRAVAWRIDAEQERLARACHASGVWLRHFQQLTRKPDSVRLRVDEALRPIRTDLKACVEIGFPKSGAAQLLALCEAELRLVEGRELPTVGVHPDFQPDNILISDDTVTVLDFTSFQYGGASHDVARFLVTLDGFRRNPLYGRGIPALMAAFLKGYGIPNDDMRPLLLTSVVRNLARLTQSVRAWKHPFPLNRLVERRAVAFLSAWPKRLQTFHTVLRMAAA